jgi:N-acetylmuramoyl-L-alanine amidase
MRRFPLALACAALLGAADSPPGDTIRVRGIAGDTVLTLLPAESGGLVRADVMARLLGGTLDSVGRGQWRLGLYGVSLELREGAPFAGYNGFTLPLIDETRVVDGAPHVTLQLFTEIIPRFGIGIIWDRSRTEIRLFQAIAKRAAPVDPAGTPLPTVAPPVPVTTAATNRAPASSGSTPPAATPSRRETAAASTLGAKPAGLSRTYRIVVDAGHGGRDPGMQGAIVNGRRITESHVTLSVSKRLARMLEGMGFEVLMTRTRDTLIAKADRGPIANRADADLFISVHVNSANPTWRNPNAVRGFETFFLSTARTEDEKHIEAMENDDRHEGEAATTKSDPLAFIINDMARNEHLRESSDLAAVVQRHLATIHPGPDRGVKQGGLIVLNTSYMPAVLVEIGFGTNPAEARWMLSEKGQEDAAKAIAAAASEYVHHYDRRTRTARR